MTRKHFKQIANAIKNNTMYTSKGCKTLLNDDEVLFKDDLINDLCIVFKQLNQRFNKQTFVDACNDNLTK